MSHYRARNRVTQLVYLLQSRRRQAVVFGPAQITILLGMLFSIGTAFSELTLTITPLALTALALGGAALYNGWLDYRHTAHAQWFKLSLLVLGVLLIAGALLLLAGVEISAPWSLLLLACGLLMLFR